MSSWRLHLCQAVLGPKAELARKLQYIVTEVIYYKLLIDKLYILNIYPFQEILKARIWAISEVLSMVSED